MGWGRAARAHAHAQAAHLTLAVQRLQRCSSGAQLSSRCGGGAGGGARRRGQQRAGQTVCCAAAAAHVTRGHTIGPGSTHGAMAHGSIAFSSCALCAVQSSVVLAARLCCLHAWARAALRMSVLVNPETSSNGKGMQRRVASTACAAGACTRRWWRAHAQRPDAYDDLCAMRTVRTLVSSTATVQRWRRSNVYAATLQCLLF